MVYSKQDTGLQGGSNYVCLLQRKTQVLPTVLNTVGAQLELKNEWTNYQPTTRPPTHTLDISEGPNTIFLEFGTSINHACSHMCTPTHMCMPAYPQFTTMSSAWSRSTITHHSFRFQHSPALQLPHSASCMSFLVLLPLWCICPRCRSDLIKNPHKTR